MTDITITTQEELDELRDRATEALGRDVEQFAMLVDEAYVAAFIAMGQVFAPGLATEDPVQNIAAARVALDTLTEIVDGWHDDPGATDEQLEAVEVVREVFRKVRATHKAEALAEPSEDDILAALLASMS